MDDGKGRGNPAADDDLELDVEILKDLTPDDKDADQVRGGRTTGKTPLCEMGTA